MNTEGAFVIPQGLRDVIEVAIEQTDFSLSCNYGGNVGVGVVFWAKKTDSLLTLFVSKVRATIFALIINLVHVKVSVIETPFIKGVEY